MYNTLSTKIYCVGKDLSVKQSAHDRQKKRKRGLTRIFKGNVKTVNPPTPRTTFQKAVGVQKRGMLECFPCQAVRPSTSV